jgi:hypothetical protein
MGKRVERILRDFLRQTTRNKLAKDEERDREISFCLKKKETSWTDGDLPVGFNELLEGWSEFEFESRKLDGLGGRLGTFWSERLFEFVDDDDGVVT